MDGRHHVRRRQARSEHGLDAIISAGFGVDANQTRSMSGVQAGFKKADLANLEVAWSIAFPGQGSGTGASPC